jgi:hypothetical protein
MWLCDDRGTIVYADIEARGLLFDGKRLMGMSLNPLLGSLDQALAKAISARQAGLVSIEAEGETDTFYTSCRFFTLNGHIHRLHLVRRMTRDISRQEVVAWKRVILLKPMVASCRFAMVRKQDWKLGYGFRTYRSRSCQCSSKPL